MTQNFMHKLTVFDTSPARLSHMSQQKQAALDAAQHAEALEAAFAEGKEAGLREVESHAESVTAALDALVNAYETQRADIEKSHHAAVLKILACVLPALASERAGKEIAAAIKHLAHNGVDGKLTVHVPPDLTSEIIEHIKAYAARIDLFENASLTANQARISWHSGGLDIDVDQAVATCLQCLRVPDAADTDEDVQHTEELGIDTPPDAHTPLSPPENTVPDPAAAPAQNAITGDKNE